MNDDDTTALQALVLQQPLPGVRTTLLWSAAVDIAEREPLGHGALGERFIVPILGGRFWGGPGFESLSGRVRPGGADRQQLRPDGVKELRAEYEMQTHDGAVLTVDNRVLIDESRQPARYAMSKLSVKAPQGPHDWLNRRIIVGTLQLLRPQREAVLVRAFLVDG
jgi:hypothetical protein